MPPPADPPAAEDLPAVPEWRSPRQRWRDAAATTLAFTLPLHALGCVGSRALEGLVAIRPQAVTSLTRPHPSLCPVP